MEIYDYKEKRREKIVLCLGFFDSVHNGHCALIRRARAFALQHGYNTAVATFSNNPSGALGGEERCVYTFEERTSIFEKLGVDIVLAMCFDKAFADLDAREFLDGLGSTHDIAAIVAGTDYTFGRGASGNIDTLNDWCRDNDVAAIIEELHSPDGRADKYASSNVRRMIETGDVRSIAAETGRNYFILGKVTSGRGDGKRFVVPTANIDYPDGKIRLKEGVYAAQVNVEGKEFAAVVNVGTHPSFCDFAYNVEAHIIDFDGELYGKTLKVEFLERLRDVRLFGEAAALKEQIGNDIIFAREIYERTAVSDKINAEVKRRD